ncbi:hypothetical protein LI291_15035, partial [Intestinibacillus massiliensis]|nr:hypothetical protein [Intestinibacillus massiliensis]
MNTENRTFSLEGENHFPRTEKLIEDYRKARPSVDIERARIYTESFKETEGEDIITRRAQAFKDYCEKREIRIAD